MRAPEFLQNSWRSILLWIMINTVLGTIIASFLSAGRPGSFTDNFIKSQINTHIISTLANIAGYLIGKKTGGMNVIKRIMYIMPGTLTAALIGNLLGIIATGSIHGNSRSIPVGEQYTMLLLPVIIITLLITAIYVSFEFLKESRMKLLRELESAVQSRKESNDKKINGSITIKEKENYFVISYEEIIYLSSSGKKTLLHTEKRDYETMQLLKEIEERLPDEIFMRIHKQFIININFISRIQYYEGGRYMVHLKDEDETILPVSRKVTLILKEMLSI